MKFDHVGRSTLVTLMTLVTLVTLMMLVTLVTLVTLVVREKEETVTMEKEESDSSRRIDDHKQRSSRVTTFS
jgi:hypothetical protein